ncbi:MAG: N-acetyltransferase family protein, partial [Actinomycetes bacterium]
DRAAVLDMHRRCTATSLRRRYLGPLPGDLDRLVDLLVPPARGLAVGAFTPEGQCVALAHLVPLADRDAVELAVLVVDDWQRYGVGLRLTQATLAVPERAGRAVFLLAHADNWPVLALARRLGYSAAPRVERGYMDMEIDGASLPAR